MKKNILAIFIIIVVLIIVAYYFLNKQHNTAKVAAQKNGLPVSSIIETVGKLFKNNNSTATSSPAAGGLTKNDNTGHYTDGSGNDVDAYGVLIYQSATDNKWYYQDTDNPVTIA